MGDKIKSFVDLKAWQKAHKFVLLIYKITGSFPKKEDFTLTSQMRRAAVAITSNIAEGLGRTSNKEKRQFYSIAQGSLTELQSQLLIARDVGYISKEEFKRVADRAVIVGKLISGLKRIGNK